MRTAALIGGAGVRRLAGAGAGRDVRVECQGGGGMEERASKRGRFRWLAQRKVGLGREERPARSGADTDAGAASETGVSPARTHAAGGAAGERGWETGDGRRGEDERAGTQG